MRRAVSSIVGSPSSSSSSGTASKLRKQWPISSAGWSVATAASASASRRAYATHTDDAKKRGSSSNNNVDNDKKTSRDASKKPVPAEEQPAPSSSSSPFPGLEGFFGNALKKGAGSNDTSAASKDGKGTNDAASQQRSSGRNLPFGFGNSLGESSSAGDKSKSSNQSNSSGSSGGSNNPTPPNALGTFVIPVAGLLLWNYMTAGDSSTREITWQEFRTAFLDKGLVDKLTVVNRSKVRVHLHSNATGVLYPQSPAADGRSSYYFSIGSVEAFEKKLDDAQKELGIPSTERVPVAYKDETSITNTLISFAPTILIFGLLYYVSRRASGGAAGGLGGGPGGIFGVGKSKARMFNVSSDFWKS